MKTIQWQSFQFPLWACILLISAAAGIGYGATEDAAVSFESESFHLSPDQLAIWNDPAFQATFTQSYIAETEIEPRVTVDERDQLQKVLNLISADKMNEAAAMLEKAKNKVTSAVFDFTLANIYFQQEKLDQAAEIYRAAVEKYPKFRRAWRNLGLIYIRQNDFQKAQPTLTRVIELGGNDAVTYGLLGFAYASLDNNLSAESAYRMAILLDPATLDWKMGLARCFFKQERFSEAIAICQLLIDQNPSRADLWLLAANAYIGLNQSSKAAEIYELVDNLGKSTPASLNILGDIYVNHELYELAVNSYIRAMDKDPNTTPDRAMRSSQVLISRGAIDQTQALVDYIDAHFKLQLDYQKRKDMLKLKARLAVAQGKGDQEIQVLEEIVQLDPLDGEALILLGQNSSRTGDTEKAIFYFERAAAIEKYEADAKVRHAQLLVGKGKYAEALPLLRRAQTINPRENIQKYLEQVERVAKTQ
jgi:tetratricopeptide (TPR) repeat protein